MNKKIKLSGFTLVELVLYIAISSMLLTSMIYFSWNLVYGRVKSTVHQEINQNLRFVAKRIAYEIRNASAVNSVSSSSISLASTDAGRNPTIIDLSDGAIRIGFGTDGSCPSTNPCNLTTSNINVTEVVFTNLTQGNSTNIAFSLTAESTSTRSEFQKSISVKSSAELRSK